MKARTLGRRLAWTAGIALLPLAVLLGLVGAAVGFVGAAGLTARISLLSVAGLVVCFAVATGFGWLAGRLAGWLHRWRLAVAIGCGTVLLAGVVSWLTVFEPLVPPAEARPLAVPPEVGFWDLSTGSRIAYRKVSARRTPESVTDQAPVIYVHGGPGAGVVWVEELVGAFSFPAELGHDVYFYDQIGGGLSGRLSDVSEYTAERHVADLEAIRREIGAETVILIAESWGAELVGRYLVAHPKRVGRLVLVSPGALDERGWGDRDPCDLIARAPAEVQEQFDLLKQPRPLVAALLLEVNPVAAHRFLGDAEGDAFFRRMAAMILPGMVCDPTRLPAGEDFGFGFWGTLMTDENREATEESIDDSLAEIDIPVLILRGECDYCVPEVADRWSAALPGSTLVHVEDAGHLLWLEKPDVLAEVVGAFLLGGSG